MHCVLIEFFHTTFIEKNLIVFFFAFCLTNTDEKGINSKL